MNQKKLKRILRYYPKSGIFMWRKAGKGRVMNKAVGSNEGRGYVRIGIGATHYYAHRLAWLYMTGGFPKRGLDHRDQDRSNNAWRNLRELSQGENIINSPHRSNNTSGATGVSWHRGTSKWRVRVGNLYGGLYEDFDAAVSARKALEQEYILLKIGG